MSETNGHAANGGGNPAAVKAVNVIPVSENGKLVGGITGKGILPGEVRNPKGGGSVGHRANAEFGGYLRQWLKTRDWARDEDGKKIVGGAREVRLATIVKRLAFVKPEVLLAYAYGKPVEMHQVQAAEGTEIEFVVRVNGREGGEVVDAEEVAPE